MSHPYLHYDVFTDRRFAGNPLAVFPEAAGLDPATMQLIAAELAFPETSFVFSGEAPGGLPRVRIFTPARELPMAGHPTVGTAFALAHLGRIVPGRPEVVFGLGVGPTRVRLEWSGARLQGAWMRQPNPVFGRDFDCRPEIAATLGLGMVELSPRSPVQEVSAGVPFLFVPLASRAAVDAARLDRAALTAFLAAAGSPELPVFVFAVEPAGGEATVYSRMFAPLFGIPEDPATGGASGPLGAYLVRHGLVPAEAAARIVSLQGVKMGRPSRIRVAATLAAGAVTGVEVGGEAVLVAQGRLA